MIYSRRARGSALYRRYRSGNRFPPVRSHQGPAFPQATCQCGRRLEGAARDFPGDSGFAGAAAGFFARQAFRVSSGRGQRRGQNHHYRQTGEPIQGAGPQSASGGGGHVRAAAIDQLAVWAERAGCEIVKKPEGTDLRRWFSTPSAKPREDYDIVIADTAGRLHTQVDLWKNWAKCAETAGKACEGAPHEAFLVLDATTARTLWRRQKCL